jgi:acetyl-CoA carboxylase biotin carboxyl carrier protein
MDIKEIQSLIKFVSKSGVHEVKLQTKDFKIDIKNTAPEKTIVQATTSVPQVTQAIPESQMVNPAQNQTVNAPEEVVDDHLLTIKSPMIGTFYRKPSPDKPTFVNVGDEVSEESVVCIIEAMKLFNEIEAEVSGKVVKVLVDDATPVEFGQPLFLVEPS